MEPISALLLAAVITKMITNYSEDKEYAKKGLESPRRKMQMQAMDEAIARIQAGSKEKTPKAPARLGARGYARELWYDAWDDLRDHRVKVRQERKDGTRPTVKEQAVAIRDWSKKSLGGKKSDGPIDDMIDVVSDPRVDSEETEPERNKVTIECPECGATLSRKGDDWQHPLGSQCKVFGLTNVQVDNTEPTTVVHDDGAYVAEVQEIRLKCQFCDARYPSTRQATIDGEKCCQRCAVEHLRQITETKEAQKRDKERKRLLAMGIYVPPEDPTRDRRPTKPTEEKPEMNAEATGLTAAIDYAHQMYAAHATHGSNETYVGALEQMGMGGEYLATAREAMAASIAAGEAWAAHEEALKKQTTLQELYQTNSDAAKKEALLNG